MNARRKPVLLVRSAGVRGSPPSAGMMLTRRTGSFCMDTPVPADESELASPAKLLRNR